MRYDIHLAPEAANDLRRLKANVRSTVRDALERHLRHHPLKESKGRIKRLRGLSHPQFRLRIDDVRVFYDVTETAVEILAIVRKPDAEAWLAQAGRAETGLGQDGRLDPERIQVGRGGPLRSRLCGKLQNICGKAAGRAVG